MSLISMNSKQFNFLPFIVLNGIKPYKFDVLKVEDSISRETLIVNASYKSKKFNTDKKEQFKFTLWKITTNKVGVFEYWLGCLVLSPSTLLTSDE